MFNWLIKLLGGYTQEYLDLVVSSWEREVEIYREELEEARKNDTPRDPKTGRFVKK